MTMRRRLRERPPLLGAWVTIAAPAVVEGLGRAGLDMVIVDLEHGEPGLEARLADLTRAADAAGIEALVRLPGWRLEDGGRLLDAGAAGIVVPQLEHSETVRRVVLATAYPPAGSRGLSVQTRTGRYGSLKPEALAQEGDHRPLLLGQIESLAGVDNLKHILAEPGLDGILLGPVDLGAALAADASGTRKDLEGVLRDIAAETAAKDLLLAAACAGLEEARRFQILGASLLVMSAGLLWKGYRELAVAIRSPAG